MSEVLSQGDAVAVAPIRGPEAWRRTLKVRERRFTALERAERQAMLAALRDAAWDREAAARDLGISRATIYRKLKRLGIASPAARLQPAFQEDAR